jgi:hypothetical protein
MSSNFFYRADVSKLIGEEFVPLVEESIRVSVIVVVVHVLMAMKSDHGAVTILRGIEMAIYAILGIATHWLLVRRIVRIN